MTWGLSTIVADIQSCAELSGIGYDIGKLELETNNDYPRIVWVPIGGNISPALAVGGRLKTGTPNTRERTVATQDLNVTVYIWGENFETTDAMLHNVVACTWRKLVGAVQFGAFQWLTQQVAEYAKRGQMVTLEMTIRIPVIERKDSLTSAAHQDFTAVYRDIHGDTIIHHPPAGP